MYVAFTRKIEGKKRLNWWRRERGVNFLVFDTKRGKEKRKTIPLGYETFLLSISLSLRSKKEGLERPWMSSLGVTESSYAKRFLEGSLSREEEGDLLIKTSAAWRRKGFKVRRTFSDLVCLENDEQAQVHTTKGGWIMDATATTEKTNYVLLFDGSSSRDLHYWKTPTGIITISGQKYLFFLSSLDCPSPLSNDDDDDDDKTYPFFAVDRCKSEARQRKCKSYKWRVRKSNT